MTKDIILDTDLGTDIDDTWALGYLLKFNQLKPRMILTTGGDVKYRANVAAKFLEDVGRDEIPVGVGLIRGNERKTKRSLQNWLGDYEAQKNYRGPFFEDGISETIRLLDSIDEPTLICIGPLPNIAEIIRRRPDLPAKCNVIAMAGSIKVGYFDKPEPEPEYNIYWDGPSARAVFEAKWKSLTITPLDHCGTLFLEGDNYLRVYESESPIAKAIIASYTSWENFYQKRKWDSRVKSSPLFDTAAIELAVTEEGSKLEPFNITVDTENFTRSDPKGTPTRAALSWVDKEAFLRKLSLELSR